MAAFNAVNKQFVNIPAFVAWLATLPPPTWHPVGSTYHNTYRPTLAQWRGLKSMLAMQADYEAKGWSSGPCLYLASGAPDPKDDGIFVMTSPVSPGTHSPSCNGARFGVEVVGDYNKKVPAPALQQLLIDAVASLHRYAGLGPDLNAHRDCDPRTCPGDAFYALKSELQAKLTGAVAVDPLRARMLPGPGGSVRFCGTGFYDLYQRYGGFATFGYALTNEAPDIGQDARPCTWMRLERACLKYVEGEGVRLALLSEAKAEGWLP